MNLSRRQLLRLGTSLATLPLAGCAATAGEEEVQTTVFYFNTVCVLGGVMPQPVLDEAVELCARFEQLFSRTIATSDVSRINAAGGAAVQVDAQTADLVRQALRYCEESDGLFDVTIGAVSELWDFVEGVVPSEEAISNALAHVGWHNVEVGDQEVRLADPLARLDLGGIAKGYIADRIIALFEERGVGSAFVNLGGNVAVLGPKADGTPWGVGVRDPKDPDGNSVVAKISTTRGSLVTSGLYERSFEYEGRRYWHILDPRTGYPVESDIVSASIYSLRSVDGDGYTKPLFMLGRQKALEFVGAHDGLQALLVDEAGERYATPGSDFSLM